MSWSDAPPPDCATHDHDGDVALVITARPRDLGGFTVGRVLPVAQARHVGPFLFFDHMGPVDLAPGHGLDVRPHPHIGLATVTYLFDGEILHRDSLGSVQAIQPGAINWMTAGRGIVHSERTPPALRRDGGRVHGLQLWCGLPTAHEETEPAFAHYPADRLPATTDRGVTLRVLAGDAYGLRSPVVTLSRLFYVDAHATTAATLDVPGGYPERAAYVVDGAARCGGATFGPRTLLVFAPDRPICLHLDAGTRLALLGGDPLDGPRHLDWNFVSSSRDRLAQARRDWRDHHFPTVPGDDQERIPLPASP